MMPEMSEFSDDYTLSRDDEIREIKGALLADPITTLLPAEPICVPETTAVQEAVAAMLARHQAGVLVVDGSGRLIGIFTERDVLNRVVGQNRDPRTTPLAAVMTRSPEGLSPRDRIGYAVHQMSVAGYRTIPLVDAERRPIGVVTVTDFVRWLVNLFPEAVLNIRPGDELKRPHEVDAG
jgi:CBS domain-containing protein